MFRSKNFILLSVTLSVLFFLSTLFILPVLTAEERQEKWFEGEKAKLMQAEQYANEQLKQKQEKVLRKAKAGKRWALFGKLGYEYDDNVPLASDKKKFRRNVGDTSAGRYRISSGFAYDFFRDAKRKAGVSYTFNQFFHDDSLNDFNYQSHITSVYGSQRFTAWNRPSEIRLKYTFAHGLLDRHTFSSSHIWNITWLGEWKENWVLSVYENLGTINFRNKGFDPSISSRDGFYEETGIQQTFLFDKRRRSISVGYEFGIEETEGNNFDAVVNGIRAVLRTPLIEKIEFEASFYFQSDYYRHFVVSPKRHDLGYQYEFRLSRPLGEHWRISAFYRRTDVNSLHDGVRGQFNYHRNIYGTELAFSY